MGKILGLSVIAFLSAISSFIGIIISLPKLINYEGANISIYDFGDYFLILLILFSTIFVIIGIISIVSAYAKSVKEAGSYVGLIYILTIIVAIGTSFSNNSDRPLLFLALPLYNSVESLKAIMTFADNAVMLTLITFFVNLVYLTIFVTLLNKMFNSEKIMFAK
jgi:sodium transport system permease protein